jgi:hypothetical protein
MTVEKHKNNFETKILVSHTNTHTHTRIYLFINTIFN